VPPASLRADASSGAELVARFAERIDVAPDGSLTVTRRDEAVSRPWSTLRSGWWSWRRWHAAGSRARRLDPRTKTLALAFDGPVLLRTLPAFDPSAPQVAPTTIFTPEPARRRRASPTPAFRARAAPRSP